MTRLLGVTVPLWFIFISPASLGAQSSRIDGGSAALGGVVFHYETRLEPSAPPLGDSLTMSVLTTPPNIVHRVMIDRAQKVFFGYDVHVATGPRERTFWLTFGPLTYTGQLMRTLLGADARSWKLLPSPKFPADGRVAAIEPGKFIIEPGEVLELPLLTNDTWGQKLIEYVTVQEAPRTGFNAERPREFSFAPGAPRDVRATDVQMTLTEPRVRWTRDGKALSRTMGDAAGTIVWVYAPNAGRFLLSLLPHDQFVRAGSIRGTSLTFTAGGNTYTVTSASRIVPVDAALNLYVLHQPAWKPTYAHADLDTAHIGAADRAEDLVGR